MSFYFKLKNHDRQFVVKYDSCRPPSFSHSIPFHYIILSLFSTSLFSPSSLPPLHLPLLPRGQRGDGDRVTRVHESVLSPRHRPRPAAQDRGHGGHGDSISIHVDHLERETG